MKVTLEKLHRSTNALKVLFNSSVPISTAFTLSKLIKDVEENIKLFEESRNTLIKKYGEEQEEGNYRISEENAEVVDKEMKELLNTEVEINAQPISIGTLQEVKMTSADVYNLDWLLTE